MFDGLARAERPVQPDLAALVGSEGWACLPRAVQRRFGSGDAAQSGIYRGSLDVHRSPIGLAFALLGLALGGPLPRRRGRDVPAEVVVRADGADVVWERRLRFGPGRQERITSSKSLGPGETLVERTGAGRGWRPGLGMDLEVREESGTLVFLGRRYRLLVGCWQVPIPHLLTPGTCRVAHRDEGEGRFRFTLTMLHPVWGLTFHQDGVFTDPEEDQSC